MPHKCYNCGQELQIKEPVQGLTTVICPNCGKPNKIGMFPIKKAPDRGSL